MVKILSTSVLTVKDLANINNPIFPLSSTGILISAVDKLRTKRAMWAYVITLAHKSIKQGRKDKPLTHYEFVGKIGKKYTYFSHIIISADRPVAYLFVEAWDEKHDMSHYVTPTSVNSNVYNEFISGKIFPKLQ